MPENYDHYISKNIKAFYKRRLAAPIIYLIVLILAWHFFSLSAVFSPDILPDDTSLETAFRGGKQYISTTLSDLKFTGYTQSIFGHTNGYYYYTMRDEECIIVLLSPNTSEEGLPSIEEVTIKGKISKGNENFDTLLSNLSTDLNWTENGIRNKVSSYYISEPGFNHVGNWILFAAIFITLNLPSSVPVPFINTALTKLSISLCCSVLESKKPICSNEKTAGELSSAVCVTVFSCVMRISDCSELFPLLLL